MPTYVYACAACNTTFEDWAPIASEALRTHPGACGGQVTRVITGVRTMGVGSRGAKTREVDATERQWDRDLPAYKRFRDSGHQPPGIDGASALESHATDDWYVKTGGRVSVPDGRRDEINEMLADGGTSDWSPVEQVHADRGAAE